MVQITKIIFNGLGIKLIDSDGNTVNSMVAVSGKPLYQNPDVSKH